MDKGRGGGLLVVLRLILQGAFGLVVSRVFLQGGVSLTRPYRQTPSALRQSRQLGDWLGHVL